MAVEEKDRIKTMVKTCSEIPLQPFKSLEQKQNQNKGITDLNRNIL
jgi:hypothetical protein